MRNSKLLKLLAALLAFGLVASACGDSDSDDGAEEGTTDTTAEGGTETTVELNQDGGSLLDAVIARGTLNCGVSGAAVAFSETQPDGSQTGFDADYCRAVAAAVLGDANAVEFSALTAAERFTAVQTGEVDVLMRNTTWTQSRDSDVGMDFGPTTYYDGQQLMARASDGFSNASQISDIDGAVVCTNAGTTTEKNIADAADAAGVGITVSTFEDFDIVTDNFISGACDIITTDGSGLVGRKAVQQPEGEEWVIFPATPISKEPLGPTYGQNDSKWADVINWTVYATIIADENGVTSANVDEMAANPPTAEIGRLLGGEGELQTAMGLPADAFYQVIKQVGNYDEIYERNLVPVGLTRDGSANAGWLDGGLIYAPPAR
ncbi:MAG: amino acid ABC transporter substrate-binding protein [Acidimicrobiales bacterium]|nr:amino acid ABC transporter substrate-binding protein [Acidimicrobiales bacterium]